MTDVRRWTPSSRIALAALLLAAGLVAGAVARAVVLAPLPSSVPSAGPADMPTVDDRPSVSREAILAAVARDPFRRERRRPPDRYRPPGERSSARRATPSGPAPRVLGVAWLPDGSGVAALALGRASARVLRVGDTIGEWRLVRVEEGRAHVAGRDTTVTLRLNGPGRR